MKKWKLLIAAVLLAVCAASVAFAAGYVKDFMTSISFILNIYDEKADKLLCGQTVVLNP